MTSKKFTRRETFALTGAAATIALTPGVANAAKIQGPEQPATDAGMFDPLTRLPNEALFVDRMRSLMRIEGTHLTVAVLDIDDWQEYKTELGDPIASAAILTFAKRITRNAVSELHTVGRLREAQFGLLFTASDPLAVARHLETIRRAIRAPMWLIQRDRFFTASIGIMPKQNFHTDLGTDMLAMTRHAALKARQQGRAGVHYFDPRDMA